MKKIVCILVTFALLVSTCGLCEGWSFDFGSLWGSITEEAGDLWGMIGDDAEELAGEIGRWYGENKDEINALLSEVSQKLAGLTDPEELRALFIKGCGLVGLSEKEAEDLLASLSDKADDAGELIQKAVQALSDLIRDPKTQEILASAKDKSAALYGLLMEKIAEAEEVYGEGETVGQGIGGLIDWIFGNK